MQNVVISIIVLGFALIEAFPASYDDRAAFIQEQAQDDYRHHQDVLKSQNHASGASINGGFNQDGSFGVTFDNNDKDYRDRGYGYEKAYAYSRETAYFDFLDDKPSINAKDIVEKYGNSEGQKDEDLFANISH